MKSTDLSHTQLMEFKKTRGVPLPDPESALGVRLEPFESLAEYQRRVLDA